MSTLAAIYGTTTGGGDPWQTRAACRGVELAREEGSDLFHPPGGEAIVAYEAARAFCRTCPVTLECLQAAMDAEEPIRNVNTGSGAARHGIWGGLSPDQRRDLYCTRGDYREAIAAALEPIDMDALSPYIRARVIALTEACANCAHRHAGRCKQCRCRRTRREAIAS